MKRRSNRSNTNSLRKNDNEDGRNTKSQNKNNEQQQRLRTRPEHRPNAFPVTTSASENNAEMTAPKRTRRSVVVSGPIKFFEETKKRKATTSSDDRRTRRKSTRSSAQRPFHHSKVLIIVDGMIEKIGSISSANSSSSSSVSSSASSSTSKEVALHSDEAIRETENSHGSVKEDLQQSHEKSENNTDTDGHHVDETTDESDGDDNVQKSMLENEHCLRKDAEQTKAVVKTKEGKNKTISVPNRNERMYTQNNVDENVENDEHLDDEHPVKEIDTSKFFDEKDDACSDDEHSRRLRSKRNRNEQRCDSSKGQNHLDEQTLSLLKECLQDDIWRHECNRIGRYRCDQLDDDDIEQFMVRMTRIADDQANQKVILLAGESSDCEFDDFSMYRECLNDAQERTLGQEYLRRIVSKIQKEYLVHHPYSKRGECLNKRTLNWFKRAVGFLGKRKLDDSRHCVNSKPPRMTGDDEGAEIVDNTNSRRSPDEDSNNGNGKLKSRTIVTRRYTRDMAISSRNQRKVKGLEILCCAIDDLEVELDNVTDSSDNSVPQSSKVAANASALELSGTGASSYTKCGFIAESWCDGIRRNKPPTRSAGYVMMAPKAAERMVSRRDPLDLLCLRQYHSHILRYDFSRHRFS